MGGGAWWATVHGVTKSQTQLSTFTFSMLESGMCESPCNSGDPGLIPGLGRSPGEGIGYPPQYSWISLVAQMVKNLPANAGDARDTDSIAGLGRSPRGGHGNPLQYSCLENPMVRGVWQATVHRVTESNTTEAT